MPHLVDVLWIISGPGQAEAAVVHRFSWVWGQVISAFCPLLSVTHPLHNILGINWSFMRVTYIIKGTCV